jgi:branched-chain amino acid aminotransferase
MGDWTDTKWAFMNGKIIAIEDANVNIRTAAFQYGTGIFEGIRAYWNKERKKMYIFRAREHYERMINSAKIIAMDIPYSIDELVNATVELLKKENFTENTYIRPNAFYSSCRLLDKLDSDKYGFSIYTLPLGDFQDLDKGLRVIVSSWASAQDNSISPRGKICGRYVNISLVLLEAKKLGFDDAIILTGSDQHVSEGAGQNIVIFRKGKFITPPPYENILEGVTLDSVSTIITEEMDMEIVERPIDRTELYQSDEIFYCGTGVQIPPIVSVDNRAIGNGKPGNYTRKIQKIFFDIVHGKNEKYMQWLTEVK